MNSLENEMIQPCWVCGKKWRRKDIDNYYYFNQMLICSSHKAAKAWYDAAIELSEEKYEVEAE